MLYILTPTTDIRLNLFMYVDTLLSPDQFAEILCDDLELPNASFAPAIASSIRQQCEQFSVDIIPEDEEDRRVIIKVHIYLRSC